VNSSPAFEPCVSTGVGEWTRTRSRWTQTRPSSPARVASRLGRLLCAPALCDRTPAPSLDPSGGGAALDLDRPRSHRSSCHRRLVCTSSRRRTRQNDEASRYDCAQVARDSNQHHTGKRKNLRVPGRHVDFFKSAATDPLSGLLAGDGRLRRSAHARARRALRLAAVGERSGPFIERVALSMRLKRCAGLLN
jgi:hypothetical protein